MTPGLLAAVMAAHLAAAISPGPAFVVGLRVAAVDGARVGYALAAGFGVGAAIWAAAALLGLTALFQIVPELLTALRYVGAAFLIGIGIILWQHADTPPPRLDRPDARRRSLAAGFRLGLVTQLANPKAAVFFGAVFIGLLPEAMSLGWIAVLLAAILAIEWGWYCVLAWALSRPRLRAGYGRFKGWIERAMGGVLAGLGARIGLG